VEMVVSAAEVAAVSVEAVLRGIGDERNRGG